MPLHETVHETAFHSPWLNTLVAHLAGLATLRPPRHYKLYHYAHHRTTGDPERDPELQNTLVDMDINSVTGYLAYLSGVPFWLDRTSTLLRHALGGEGWVDAQTEYFIRTKAQKMAVVAEARMCVCVYVFLAWWSVTYGHSTTVLAYWVVPSLLGQVHLRWYLLAEHNNCQLGDDMFANTRTTTTHPLYARLAWQMPFHAEHHRWPSLPFYLLPAVHQARQAKVNSGCDPDGSRGYFSVHVRLWKSFLGIKEE